MRKPANFMPQDDYLATQATEYSDVDRRTLTYLYQPILGPVATALYTSLWLKVSATRSFRRIGTRTRG
ncbi:hypothetical protein [Lacticaseibacillus thailandensis]|uniref:hypothetical protein n=1 Tax=Lacticaseibacillus thailandensis TaxID=381741 RepID=UPI0006D08D50|nr:hypothetical protein [Lacticaseibacillus thailandensis]